MVGFTTIFKGIGVSAVMDKKENDIDSIEVKISSENPNLDLKAIRESMGLTLEGMSSSTRVSLSNLKAIENQTFELLPEPIYVRAFIGTYARALGIDGEEMLSRYDTYLEGLEPNENHNKILKQLSQKKSYTKFWIWLAIATCVIAAIGVFSFYQWSQDGSQEMKEPAPVGEVETAGELQGAPGDVLAVPEKDDVAAEEGEFQDSSGDAPAPENDGMSTEENGKILDTQDSDSTDSSDADDIQKTAPVVGDDILPKEEGAQSEEKVDQPKIEVQQPEVQSAPDEAVTGKERSYILVIEASELTWIQIQRDAESSFEIMLRPGESVTEKASEKFSLIIGNAAGVDISFQGKPLGLIGEQGEVVHLILPADR